MELLYCDETNLDYKDGDFFVYGGLSIPDINALELSNKIDEIRKAADIPSEFLLKFNLGPPDMNHQQFIQVKKNIIKAAIEANCELYISVILHNIGRDTSLARRNEISRVIFN